MAAQKVLCGLISLGAIIYIFLGDTPEKQDNCDPAYPDVCIPPPKPDLDCEDIVHRNFRALPAEGRTLDPHFFDPDRDGIGCEK